MKKALLGLTFVSLIAVVAGCGQPPAPTQPGAVQVQNNPFQNEQNLPKQFVVRINVNDRQDVSIAAVDQPMHASDFTSGFTSGFSGNHGCVYGDERPVRRSRVGCSANHGFHFGHLNFFPIYQVPSFYFNSGVNFWYRNPVAFNFNATWYPYRPMWPYQNGNYLYYYYQYYPQYYPQTQYWGGQMPWRGYCNWNSYCGNF